MSIHTKILIDIGDIYIDINIYSCYRFAFSRT